MVTWIVLLRGINIGGHHIVPMKRLRELLENAGLSHVQTYIQSGNCVFRSEIEDRDRIGKTVSGLIEGEFGFRPTAFVLTPDELEAAITSNPFPADNPKFVHLQFLAEPPAKADFDGLRAVAQPGEDFALTGDVLYLYLPHGAGRSPVAQKLGQFVKADMTGRNIASVMKIAELARGLTG
ncbi:DUF1697 domain-containing protein [Oricola nitratireducens]|uniref:DUF1697 domain-containing protein n=1 Tax=Oricola nitratireducens TaxID=2775868 RepID=UPI0018695A48|nr:DUF1697 domain-containing protein [Oricola nitratireducens]